MSISKDNNKRIAKNTVSLYIRMFFVMAVSLYTSRIILDILGVEDFGIYNLVAGVVILFSFLNNAMTTASQRYLNVAISKKNVRYVQKVFSTILVLHFSLVLVVLLLSETIGLWFISYKLNIPEEKSFSALIAYQFAIATACIGVIKVPYNATVIANERMGFYAITGLIDVSLKLIVVWLIPVFGGDKLITYSALLLIVNIISLIWYIIYSKMHFEGNKFSLITNKDLLLEMASFSGWNLFGTIADIGYKQGTNFILNIFCGVALNATMGIVNQIRSAIFSFTANLQVAANPQIIKSYSKGEFEYFRELVCSISKYSYFLMLLLCLPVILNADYLLHLWLSSPPQFSITFTILILVFCLIDSLNGPLWVSMQAYGKIKMFQVLTSACLLLNLPCSYFALKLGFIPESVLIIQILIAIISLFVRLLFSNKFVGISYKLYFRKVISPILIVTVCAIPIPSLIITKFIGVEAFLLSGSASVVCTIISVYFLGLENKEKDFLINIIRQKINK